MAVIYGPIAIEIRDDTGVADSVFLPIDSTPSHVNAVIGSFGFPPPPDWLTFKVLAMESQELTALMQGISVGRPQLLGWLAEALARAEAGDVGDFDRAWGLVVETATVPAVLLESFAETARSCGLSASFVSLLLRQ